jgi:hypothetical protein
MTKNLFNTEKLERKKSTNSLHSKHCKLTNNKAPNGEKVITWSSFASPIKRSYNLILIYTSLNRDHITSTIIVVASAESRHDSDYNRDLKPRSSKQDTKYLASNAR